MISLGEDGKGRGRGYSRKRGMGIAEGKERGYITDEKGDTQEDPKITHRGFT